MSSSETNRVQARLDDYAPLTETVVSLRVAAPEDFEWLPGQHIALGGDEAGKGASYYSIASAPQADQPGVFELAAGRRTFPAGFALERGSEFWLSPAQGKFPYAHLQAADEVVLIGIGTGVSPLRAVVQALMAEDGPKISLFQGARTQQECLFFSEFEELSGDRLRYFPVLSRESNKWKGLRGHVQEHLDAEWDRAEFCMCGSKTMVSEVKELLGERGVTEERIFGEGY